MLIKFRIPEIVLGVFLTVAVFAIGYVIASSVPPPSQQIESTNHQQATNYEGTERTAEKQIAYYTKWLAWFTGALVAVSFMQGYFLLRSDKTARIVANAADLSARAAIALQLPIIRVKPNGLSKGDFSQGGEMIEHCDVDFIDVYNIGPTKAFPKEVLYGWSIGDDLPIKPRYSFADRFPVNGVLEADPRQRVRQRLVGMCLLKPGEWTKICGGNHLWFYCEIIYEDFMEEKRSHGFCWRWQFDGMSMTWREDGTPAYNQKT